MAKYRITGPDGQAYEITAPEGASEQDVMSFVQSQIGGNDFASQAAGMSPTALSVARAKNDPFGEYLRNQAMQPRAGETEDERYSRLYGSLSTEDRPGYGEGIARSVVQGGMFGGGDEVVAAGAAALDPLFKAGNRGSYGDRYDAYLARERARLGQFRDDSPVTAFGSEAAGAIPTAMLPVVRGVQAAQGAGMLGRMGAGAVTGAAQGGLYGYLSGEGDERGDNAMFGASAGAVVGGLAPPVIDFAAKTLRYLGDQTIGRMGGQRQATAALRKISQAFMRDGLTPEQAAQKLNQMGPEAALMDLGPNTRALAASTSRAPGAGKTIIDDFVTPRQEGARNAMNVLEGGQINRITSGIDELVPENFYKTLDNVNAQNLAGDLYDRAYKANQFVDDKVVNRILKTPAGKSALRKAAEKMQNDMTSVSRLDPELTAAYREAIALGKMDDVGTRGVGRGLKLRTLDYVKRALGDMERSAGRDAPDDARIVGKLRRELTKALDAADVTGRAGPRSFRPEGGAYAQARSLAADKFAQQDAISLGADFMRAGEFKNPVELQRAMAEMGAQERHLFRVGAAQSLKDKIGGLVNRADATKRISDIPALEQKIRIAFGDDDIFRRYIDMTRAERAMFDSYSAVKGGSQTAERLAADADAAVDPGAAAEAIARLTGDPFSIGNILNAARTFGGNTVAQAQTPEPVRRELAKLLTGRSTDKLDDAIAAQMASEEGRRNLARILTTTGIVAAGR